MANSTINKILNNKTKKEKETVKAVADSIMKQRGSSTSTTSDNDAKMTAIASLLKNTNTTAEKATSAVSNVSNLNKLKTPTDLRDTTARTPSPVQSAMNSSTTRNNSKQEAKSTAAKTTAMGSGKTAQKTSVLDKLLNTANSVSKKSSVTKSDVKAGKTSGGNSLGAGIIGKSAGGSKAETELADYFRVAGINQNGVHNQYIDPYEYKKDMQSLYKTGTLKSDRITQLTDEQLSADIEDTKRMIAEAKEKENAYNPNATKEERAKPVMEAKEKESRLRVLSTYGLPFEDDRAIDWDMYSDDSRYRGDDVYLTKRPENWDPTIVNPEDRVLFDAIYGQGAYDEIVFNGTDEENKALEQELDELWYKLETHGFDEEHDAANDYYEKLKGESFGYFKGDQYERQLKKLTGEMERRETAATYESNMKYNDTAFHMDLLPKETIYRETEDGEEEETSIAFNSAADRIYLNANDKSYENMNEFDRYHYLSDEQFMTPEMLATFNGYYNAGDKESALAYYNALQPALQQMKLDEKQAMEISMSRNEYAPGMIFKRILGQPIAGIQGVAGTIASLWDENALNPNNEKYWGLTQSMQNIQGARGYTWGEQLRKWFGDSETTQRIGEWMNGVAYSMADNLVARGIGMGIGSAVGNMTGKLAGNLIQIVMSSEATANTMYNAIQDGNMDPTEAFIRAIASGAVEWVTEKYSTDRFFENLNKGGNGIKDIARRMVSNFIPEAQEEMTGKVLESLVDDVLSKMYDHRSEFEERVEKYREEYGDDAESKALEEYFFELLSEGLAGGVSGALMSGASDVVLASKNYSRNTEIGNRAINANIAENAQKRERTTGQAINKISLVEMGRKMGVGTESREIAEKIQKGILKGKAVKSSEYGELIRAMMHDTDEAIGGTIRNIVGTEMEQRLIRMGESEQAAKDQGAALANLISQSYTSEDIMALAKSKNAQALLKEFGMQDSSFSKQKAELEEEIKGYKSIQENVEKMLAEPQISVETAREIAAGAETVNDEDYAEAAEATRAAGGEVTGDVMEAVTDGMIKKITGVRTVTDENGEKRLQVLFGDESADIGEVKARNLGVAQVLQFAQRNGNTTTSDAFTEAMLKNVSKVDDAATLIAGAQRIRWDVVTGQKTIKSGLSSEVASSIRTAAENDLRAWDAKRTENYKAIHEGKGETTFNGVKYSVGTKAFTEALAKAGISKQARTEAQMIGSIAQAMGFDVNLINDTENTAEQGYYTGGENGNGITINLAGTFNKDGLRRSALATLPHEITHWLEGNSPEAYKALRTFVLQGQRNQGINLEGRLQSIMDTYAAQGVNLDMFDAVSELVAKSCEEVLTNEKMIRQLQAKNPQVYGKVRSVVNTMIDRVRTALGFAKQTSSIYAKGLRDYSDQLAKVWMAAYEEAKNATGTGTENSKAQLSIEENDNKEDRQIKAQVNSHIDELINSEPISEISSDVDLTEYYKRGAKSKEAAYKMWAREISKGFNVTREGLGAVLFTDKSIAKGFRYLKNDLQRAAFAATPQIIQYGDEINFHEHHKGGQADSHTYAGKVLYDGEPRIMAVVVRFSENDNRYKTHKVFLPDGSVLDLENNKAEAAHTPAGINQQEYTSSASEKSIPQQNKGSKSQRSIQETDAEYMQAVNSGNTEEAQRMVDQAAETAMPNSKVRDKTGKLLKVYHGTKADFNEFRRDYIGSTGRFEGSGFNFTPYEGRAKSYGGNVLAGYLNIQNPLSAEEKTISVAKLARLIREADPTGDNIISDYARETRDYGSDSFVRRESMTAARNIWEASENDVDIYSFISAADSDAEGLISKFSELGYDGLIHYNDDGSIKTAVAFSSEQFKKADPVTYDDDGNVIPPSERFKTEKKDIRYSIQEDNTGHALTEGQREFFKNSKAVDDKGRLVKLYHGTVTAGFTVFEKSDDIGYFFTDDPEVARTYSDTGRAFAPGRNDTGEDIKGKTANYAVYLNIENPLIIDGNWSMWNAVIDSAGGDMHTWDELTEEQQEQIAENMGMDLDEAEAAGYDENGLELAIYDLNSMEMRPYQKTREWVTEAKEIGYDGVIFRNIQDEGMFGGGMPLHSDVYVALDSNQIKSVRNENPTKDRDIRYSIADDTTIVDEDGNAVAEILPGKVVTAYSLRTVEDTVNEDLAKALVDQGFKRKDVDKWIKDVYSIARMVADDKQRLDFKAVGDGMLKNNAEYIKTLDASTLCVKRQLYQGIFNEIQHMLPNTPLLPEDLLKLTNMMKERGMVSPCSLCYVESRRRMLGKYASEWLKTYEGAYKPRIEELTTTDGLQALKEAPEGSARRQAYEDFNAAMNAKGTANPKVVQMRGEYKGEIMDMTDRQIKKVKEIGGLRVQSFSDFETVHLLDMMQAVMDMAARDLTSQAYTKVPDFAWVFGGTGMKINLSLIGEGTGLDENGNLKFSDTEGMPLAEALAIREAYSKNVGTILVGMNDDHIIKAMGDGRIDFIIPFHKSGWSKREMALMIGMGTYKDYTRFQNEKKIDYVGKDGKIKTIPNKKSKISNFGPVNGTGKWDGQSGYWDFKKTGTQNAEAYLKLCAKDGRVPKFANFLVNNGDGSFSLPTDDSERSRNIRNGYWKLLIDFKMYDNSGKGSPQTSVKPIFNMDAARDILNKYEGGADTLPTNHALANAFVEEYKAEHPGRKQYSIEDDNEGNIYYWMRSVKPETLQTAAEKELLEHFKAVDMRIDLRRARIMELKDKIAKLEAMGDKLDRDGKRRIQKWKVEMANAQQVKEAAEAELAEIISSEGYGKMMKNQQRIFNDFMYGKTSAEVTEEVGNLQKQGEKIAQMIDENMKRVKEIESKGVIGQLKKILGTTTADQTAAELKKEFHSTWTKGQIRNYIDQILLKLGNGQDITSDVEELAGILIDSDERNEYEGLSALRGLAIRIGHGMMNELHANDSSLKEIRNRLAGTGIKVVAAKKVNGQWESSTLEQDVEDLRAQFPNMPELGNEKDALENFVSWVEGMKQQSGGQEFYAERLAEAMAQIMTKVVSTAQGMYIPTEAKAQKQVLALVEFVKGLQAQTESAISTLENVAEEATKLMKSGGKAAGLANVLTQHIGEALEYYDKTAKIAVDKAKQERNNTIVDQLKSKHAQDIAKRNEEWRNLIERDKNAREQVEQNRKYKNQINTVLKRAYKKLRAPKGMDNIPEYMQGIAREVIETFVTNDLAGNMRFTDTTRENLLETMRVLDAWKQESGTPTMPEAGEAEAANIAVLNNDLQTIYDGLDALKNGVRGKNRLETLRQQGEILRTVQEAVSEIWSAIRAENEIQVNKRKVGVETQAWKIAQAASGKNHKEWTGKLGGIIRTMHKAIVSGNMTPEYFFRTLGNEGLSELWENYHEAENRNGLELKKAQERLAEIAEKHGYKNWDTKQKITLKLMNGAEVEMTVGQLMSLWATWKREMALGPTVSEHLAGGGFFAEQDTRDGLIGRKAMEKRAHRISVDRDLSTGEIKGSRDMDLVKAMLTDEQLAFIDDVVSFMSNEMSALGNEASMAAYGIKMYKEGYYFPFQMWDGVRSRKSNDSGSAAGAQDRAFHPSFSKSRIHGANNAVVIGDFLQTAADHIAGMINYATMGLANESLQKALNVQLSEMYLEDETNKRNVWTMLEEAYGAEAVSYLRELQKQLNGGAVKIDRTFYDKAISLFRKNAVAGSLSVAFQQPMSYIRAAMMISPKHLAAALGREYWSGAYDEMMAHSGVAVIKNMGRFDMNAGQSAREYLMPDGKESTARKVYGKIADYSTILPEKMDAWTWTRMWVAVKHEQHEAHPEMDVKSDAFLDLCGERFNDLMRRTQVYDSVLVRSANMRSTHPWTKSLTSFMAEPTLTLNVLADSVRSALQGEAGGKAMLAKAGATFALSAVMQSVVKALFSSGRSPDDKKTWLENFLYRLFGNLVQEANPVSLIPGYGDLVTLLKKGELSDDAMGAIGKLITAGKGTVDVILGNGQKGLYRDLEDSIGQLAQIFTNVPVKNIMRDARAMYNWITGENYAERATDPNVILYQTEQAMMNADNLVSAALTLGGYKLDNAQYYSRIYEAKKAGKDAEAQGLIDYLIKGKGVKEETISSSMVKNAKADSSISKEKRAEIISGATSGDAYNEAWWKLDRDEYQQQTGAEKAPTGYYYRLTDAVDNNSVTEIRSAVKELKAHGVTEKKIMDKTSDWKAAYLQADNAGKVKIRNAIQQVYIAAGSTAAEADKKINKWK